MIHVPEELAAAQEKFNGAAGRAFVSGLPGLAAAFLEHWDLRVTGAPMHGVSALVLPVDRADGTPAVLKLQILDEETEGEPVALRAWDGDGAVRLLDHDTSTGTLLLERLDPARTLARLPDVREAVLVVARLLAHLTGTPAPAGLRHLGDIAHALLERTPGALSRTPDPAVRRTVADCAAALREVADEPGDRLLHWDLHYDNVLAADRAPWLAIDPKPLAGDPGFDLWPALANRFDADDPDDPGNTADTAWRFDAMTDVLGLDRDRARAWTYARLLQNCLWHIEDGRPPTPRELEIAHRLRRRPSRCAPTTPAPGPPSGRSDCATG
ncbi:aminoglycoside phosphotransferase family protein [Streptomyces sp. NPDC050388]|uniref:aminoglycoside phosphotransferase family protein n=1 Tax=Streptomyces sp. NPDC050388 TaxID=3155781 RepID=UPI00341E5187